MKRLSPSEFANGGFGCCPDTRWLRSHGRVFSMRFVPHGNQVGTLFRGEEKGLKLSLGLMCETIADTKRKLGKNEHDCVLECGDLAPLWISIGLKLPEHLLFALSWLKTKAVP